MAKANVLPLDKPDHEDAKPGLSLRDIQDRFQAAILSGDDAVLADILGNSRTGREVLFGVYRHAYAGRLIEVLAHDHEALQAYLGGEGFETMARAYIAAYPSRTQNARWVSRNLPLFLTSTGPYSENPHIADLAVVEAALNNAFDAADGPVIGVEQLAAFAPDLWGSLQFKPHSSAHRFNIGSNALDIWRALRDDAEPPEPEVLAEVRCDPAGSLPLQQQPIGNARRLLVWRQGATPMIRALEPEEAMMWDECAKGVRFSSLCEMVATYDRPEEASMRAAKYLAGWLSAGLLSAVQQWPSRKRKPAP